MSDGAGIDSGAALAADGFVILEDVLTEAEVDDIRDRVDVVYRTTSDAPGEAPLQLLGFLGRDPGLVTVVDRAPVLDLVRGALGDDVYVYHSHLDVHPRDPAHHGFDWHQDLGVVLDDLPTLSAPMCIKVGIFLTDVLSVDAGPMHAVPGSHLLPRDTFRPEGDGQELLVRAGSAVVFDHRVWHSRGVNRSGPMRRALFLSYAFRWVRPRHAFTMETDVIASLSPVQRQLVDVRVPGTPLDPRQQGDDTRDVGRGGGERYHDPKEVDIPLRGWVGSSSEPRSAVDG